MIEWNDNLKIGIKEIDEQHEEFFMTANDLLENLRKGDKEAKRRNADEILIFLKDYLEYHFEEEEKFQKKIDHNNYESHKQDHQEFIKKVDDIIVKLGDNKTEFRAIFNLHNQVLSWFTEHISNKDQKIKDCIADKKE